jgi:Restriction endonuclease S subunits
MEEYVRTRIEKISEGIVPDGYKRFGHFIIPKEWKSLTISDVVVFEGGSQPPRSEFIYQEKEGYVRLIQIRDYKTDEYKTYIPIQKARKFCDEKDVMIGRYGPPIFQILRGIRGAYNVALIKAIPDERKLLKDYLYYYLQNETLFKLIDRLSRRTSGQTGIDMDALNNFPLPLPSIAEQVKIVNVIKLWDKAIELKEKLIEQKKEQKKGLMQRLLTGKVRLSGFEGEWVEFELGDIGEFKTSSVDKKVEEGQQLVELVNYMDVYHNRIIDENISFMKVSASEREIDAFSVEYGDVLFTPSSETPDDIGHSAVVKLRNKKVLFSYHLVRLRFKREMDINFKAYIFNSDDVLREFSRRATGVTRYTLSLNDFKEVKIRIPISLEEQKKIGEILLLADNEIKLLQQELEALKQQKKGLMQLLLTGKVRVKC